MQEESLDPQDWNRFRQVLHSAADEVVDFLSSVREAPVWQAMPQQPSEPLPLFGEPEEQILQSLAANMLPYRLGNIHPRFWTRVGGTGTPMGVLADMMASAANTNAAGQDSSGTRLESQVIEWFKEIMGFPSSASGVLTAGASTANLIGLAAARQRACPEIRTRGAANQPRLTVYCSEEAHVSIDRAAVMLGIGLDQVRRIPADDQYRIRLDILQDTIAEDRVKGFVPLCVVGTAGTVASGATDDLTSIAELCQRERLWFHIDGAFGALLKISPKLRHIVQGLEQADSLGFDLHKWLHVPYDAGCALVRNADVHRAAFSYEASYLGVTETGPSAAPTRFYELGIDLSRAARGVKVWASLKHFGLERYARSIEQNVEQASYLAGRIEREPALQLAAPVPLNVVCFRFSGTNDPALHERVTEAVQESGLALISTIALKGETALRVCITNHRTRREDLDLLLEAVLASRPGA
jgi:glutamate/tyrosine decarboxylase-like PLP-dependent enzyme